MSKNPFLWSVVNQKGGVGKTTTTINLSSSFSSLKQKTLIIDLDPQGNASTGVGITNQLRQKTSYDLFKNDYEDIIQNTQFDYLDIIPASINLSGLDIELSNNSNKLFIIKDFLKNQKEVLSQYKFIVFDCPPSLGISTINALNASNSLIVPLQCEFFSLEGLSHLLGTVKSIQKNHNPKLYILGILLTMFDQRNKVSSYVADEVRKYLKHLVFDTVIPRNVRLSEAPSHGKPAILYDKQCLGSQAYIRLAKEILTKIDYNQNII